MQWFNGRSLKIKCLIALFIVGIGWFGISKFKLINQQPQYQTAKIERSTLTQSLSLSGQVLGNNNAPVTTNVTGVVKEIFVKNGDKVAAGDKIAEIDLDLFSKQKSSQALASYQSAQNSLANAQADLYSSQSTLLNKWKTFIDLATNPDYENADDSPRLDKREQVQFMTTNNDWLAAESKYKIQQNIILQTQTSLSASWYSYQQNSPIVYAPISGEISGLSLQTGSILTTSQKIANILTGTAPTVSINLTEIDIAKVKEGQKATVTLDAYPNKTFKGTVISVDNVGTISSGVINYPAIIKFDKDVANAYSNMSAQANIVISTKENVLLAPYEAIQTRNGNSFIRILDGKKIKIIPVIIGDSSDTQTEISGEGIKEGDFVIIGAPSSRTSTSAQSPFSGFGGRGISTFGGGGTTRTTR